VLRFLYSDGHLFTIVMAMDDRGYAALLLGQWARNHGIYEIRAVLAAAVTLAEQAASGEELGIALEQAAVLKKALVADGDQADPGQEPAATKAPSKPRVSKKADSEQAS
jgi:hypothetical protein